MLEVIVHKAPSMVLTMPAILEFRLDDDTKDGPVFAAYPWLKWSWCHLEQFMFDLHYRFHPRGWDFKGQTSLLDAFPWTPSPGPRPNPVLLLQRGYTYTSLRVVDLEEYKRHPYWESNSPLYVPAGWAKAVLKAVATGAKKAELINDTLVWMNGQGQYQRFSE